MTDEHTEPEPVSAPESEATPDPQAEPAAEPGSPQEAAGAVTGTLPAESPTEDRATRTASSVFVDNHGARSDDDALEGHFVRVVSGEHKGVYGALVDVLTRGEDGYPDKCLVRQRDPAGDKDLVGVDYVDLRPA